MDPYEVRFNDLLIYVIKVQKVYSDGIDLDVDSRRRFHVISLTIWTSPWSRTYKERFNCVGLRVQRANEEKGVG